MRHWVAFAILTAAAAAPAVADEGMWTFDNPPTRQIQEKYHYTLTRQWLDHVRLSSARLNDGGSGSFVSPHGLLLTNHHVARGQLQKNSTPEHDYIRNGFYAATQAEEMKSPDLEVNVLISSEDVTPRVEAATRGAKSPEAQFEARRKIMAGIERESTQKTGLRSDIITLYQGGEYWLYRYKKYTDVRLVFAPEEQAAYFGGDSDNFTYPRYDLDMALFRVYENGKPVDTPNYLKWNPDGAHDDELLFVSGNPYGRSADFNHMPPFNLVPRFAEGQGKLNLGTPLNFVTTDDIIGGNSGSPVINGKGELVGLIFDGNIESLVGDYVYDIEANRAVAVHTAGMTEALKKLYNVGPLLNELLGR